MRYGRDKAKIMRRIMYGVLIAVAVLLQNNIAVPVVGFHVRALFVLPLLICISMFEREVPAALFGALGGILWDISSGVDGFHALTLSVICAACSIMISHFMRNNIVTSFVLGGSGIMLFEFTYILVFDFVVRRSFPLHAVLSFYIPTVALTFLLIPVFFFIIKAINTSLRSQDRGLL